MPDEGMGWEENPPDGDRIHPSRSALVPGQYAILAASSLCQASNSSAASTRLAILMFVGSPAWIGMLVLGTLSVALAETPGNFMRADAGIAIFVLVLLMWFAPKTLSAIDLLLRPQMRRAFGGATRFLVNFVVEMVFSILLCPIMWFGHAIFLSGLLFGREIGWIGQTRDDHAVPIALALHNLWPHTLFGVRRDRVARDDASGGDPLCAVPRRRAGTGHTARRRHRTAVARRDIRAHRHRSPARGDRAATRALRAGAAGHRVRGAAAAAGLKLFRLIYRIAPDPWLTSEFLF